MDFGLNFLMHGMAFGFSIAMPIGPIGILCIRRTLQYGRLYGIISGLGASFANIFYGSFVIFGLATLSHFLIAFRVWLCLLGGLFLIFFGLKIFMDKPQIVPVPVERSTTLAHFLSTFFLTMTSPVTFIAFINVLGGLEYGKTDGNVYFASLLVGGIFLGSMLWWLMLCFGLSLFRKQISGKTMMWVNRIAGILIIFFGIYSLYSL